MSKTPGESGPSYDEQWGGMGLMEMGYLVTPYALRKFRKRLRINRDHVWFLQGVVSCWNLGIPPYVGALDMPRGTVTKVVKRLVELKLIINNSKAIPSEKARPHVDAVKGSGKGVRYLPEYDLTPLFKELRRLIDAEKAEKKSRWMKPPKEPDAIPEEVAVSEPVPTEPVESPAATEKVPTPSTITEPETAAAVKSDVRSKFGPAHTDDEDPISKPPASSAAIPPEPPITNEEDPEEAPAIPADQSQAQPPAQPVSAITEPDMDAVRASAEKEDVLRSKVLADPRWLGLARQIEETEQTKWKLECRLADIKERQEREKTQLGDLVYTLRQKRDPTSQLEAVELAKEITLLSSEMGEFYAEQKKIEKKFAGDDFVPDLYIVPPKPAPQIDATKLLTPDEPVKAAPVKQEWMSATARGPNLDEEMHRVLALAEKLPTPKIVEVSDDQSRTPEAAGSSRPVL